MNKKLVGIVAAFFIVVVGLFAAITFHTIDTKVPQTEMAENKKEEGNTTTGDQSKAESLLGQDVSQDDVNKQVGTWNDFEMSSEGCERGVYSGKFYYDNFTIFSKTYDKGKTYHIESINEK